MKSIGVKKLKDQLSQYLKFVRNGETIIVTARNEIIAEIRKPSHDNSNNNLIKQYLEVLAKEGKIIPSKRTKSLINTIVSNKKSKKIAWKEIYKQAREDWLE